MKPAAAVFEFVLVALACVAGGALAKELPFLGLPIAAAALAWLSYRFGYPWAALVGAGAGALVGLLYGSTGVAVLVAPSLILAGPVTAWALTRWPAVRVGAFLWLGLFGVAVGWLGFEALTAKTSIGAVFAGMTKPAWDAFEAVLVAQRVGTAAEVHKAVLASLEATSHLWPSATFAAYGIAAVPVIPVVARSGVALGAEVNRPPKLPELDLSAHLVWPVITGLGLLAYTTYLRITDGPLWSTGANLLDAVRWVLFLQGVAAFSALYRKAKLGRFGRVLGYTLLTISEVVVPSISVLGLVDLFANLRKLPRAGTPSRPADA